MKISLLRTVYLFIFTLLTLYVHGQNTATLRGSVKTSDGKPAEAVTVTVMELSRSTFTDEKGNFRFNRLPAGTYRVVTKLISFKNQEQQVVVKQGQELSIELILSETAENLEEVTVSSGKTNKFASKKSDFVARMPLENLENPQVYSSVNKELLIEQIVVDFKESLRNVPGVSPGNNPAGGTGGTIRGFSATTTVRNGLAVQSYQSDPIMLERVEVIKGPSGTLFGSSIVSFGGLMNQVTKKPLDTFRGEVSMTLGQYELSRISADINTPLNEEKTALLRINTAAHKENSFQNYGHKRMYTFAPSLSYKVDDRLSFLFEAELNKTDRSTIAYYQNLNKTNYKNFKDIPVPFDIALTGSNLGAELSATNLFAEGKYVFSDQWTSTTSIAYGENQIQHSHQVYPQWTGDNKFDRSISSYGPRIFTSLNGQQNFNGDFKIAGMRNRVLVGLNFYTFRSFLRFTPVGIYDKIDLSASPVIPGINLEKVNNIIAASATQSNTESTQGSYSAYASDVLNVTDRLAAMLSLRVDRFENAAQVVNGIKAATGSYNQTAYSPKLGLTYQVLKDRLSVFGNYMNGFQNLGSATQPDGVVESLKPRQANQWEGGLKLEVFNNRLNATFSYYDIKITNDTRLDNGYTIQDATSRSKGFEADLIANPVTGLNIIAGYASNSYKILKAASFVGNSQAQVPTDYVNFWASYKFSGRVLRNLGAGFGGNYVAECFFDAANAVTIPAYTVLNASVFYDQPKWRVGLKVNNMTDEKYWTNWGIPETLRQYLGSITFRF